MSSTFGLSLLAASVGFAVTVLATDKPPKEFQDIMKSNGSIVDISLGMVRSIGGPGLGQGGTTTLRAHIRAKDYDGIAADAATLKANFMKVEAFWTQRKVDDAINFSKAAVKAATDLEAAAKANDDARISMSANAVAATCRDCHQAHRVMNLADGTFEIQ
jgi:hypothetical protein